MFPFGCSFSSVVPLTTSFISSCGTQSSSVTRPNLSLLIIWLFIFLSCITDYIVHFVVWDKVIIRDPSQPFPPHYLVVHFPQLYHWLHRSFPRVGHSHHPWPVPTFPSSLFGCSFSSVVSLTTSFISSCGTKSSSVTRLNLSLLIIFVIWLFLTNFTLRLRRVRYQLCSRPAVRHESAVNLHTGLCLRRSEGFLPSQHLLPRRHLPQSWKLDELMWCWRIAVDPAWKAQRSKWISFVFTRSGGAELRFRRCIVFVFVTRGRKAPESRFHLCVFSLLLVLFWISWTLLGYKT